MFRRLGGKEQENPVPKVKTCAGKAKVRNKQQQIKRTNNFPLLFQICHNICKRLVENLFKMFIFYTLDPASNGSGSEIVTTNVSVRKSLPKQSLKLIKGKVARGKS